MSRNIRVLIADDSTVTRRILLETLSAETDLEVVGAAANGEEAIALFRAQKPDVVLLDVDMPVINGIEALRTIRCINASVPVVMFSTLTVRGGEATLDALAAGATDYVPKPTGVGHVDKAMEYLKMEVVPRLRQWGRRQRSSSEPAGSLPTMRSADAVRIKLPPMPIPGSSPAPSISGSVSGFSPPPAQRQQPIPETRSQPGPEVRSERLSDPARQNLSGNRRRSGQVSVLAIGSSTGGPNALADVVSRLPGDLNIPVLITQHMPPVFTQLLAERLDRGSRLTVREGVDGAVVRPGEVWIAPGDSHMIVAREGTSVVIRITKTPPENSCRPAVDVLFRSVAEVYGGSALAVVLTGMGKDGTAGCQKLSQLGAGILVQDEASSVVWGMPRSVAEAGLADAVVPLNEMHMAIMTRVRSSLSLNTTTS